MRVSISRSDLRGSISAPSSKSYTIRGLVCAALAHGETELVHPLASDDTDAALGVLSKLGVTMRRAGDSWLIRGGEIRASRSDLDCRESAATLRFLTAIAATIPGQSRLIASSALALRPIEPLLDALRQLGIECRREETAILINGGRITRRSVALPGDISSQFVSALLLIAPLSEDGLTVKLTTNLESRPYVDMTIQCLSQFGITVVPSPDYRRFYALRQTYAPTRYVVEGDWSSASYLLAMGTLSGDVRVQNLNPRSLQGDKALLYFLREMGAQVSKESDAVRTSRSALKPIVANLNESIDLLPTMAVLAAFAEGRSELHGVARARLKESDRIASMAQELRKAGVEVQAGEDQIVILGGNPSGAIFDSHNDHRIAMAMSLIGLACGNTIIEGAECVSKTFPQYWDVLKKLGAKVEIDGR